MNIENEFQLGLKTAMGLATQMKNGKVYIGVWSQNIELFEDHKG